MALQLALNEAGQLSLRNCPPQGNLGGGVDEVLDLEAVARRWLVDLGWVRCGVGVFTDSKFLIGGCSSRAGGSARIAMKAESWVSNPEWESWKWGCYQTLNKKKITSNLLLGDGM